MSNLITQDLYTLAGLTKLNKSWLDYLHKVNPELTIKIKKAVANESDLIIELAPYLEEFIAVLFDIKAEVATTAVQYQELAPVYECKRNFVHRYAIRQFPNVSLETADKAAYELLMRGLDVTDEIAFASYVSVNPDDEDAAMYASWATLSQLGQQKHKGGILFKVPKNSAKLFEATKHNNVWTSKHHRERNGFVLPSEEVTVLDAFNHSKYCIHCHRNKKDSCAKGLKIGEDFKINEHKIVLHGCPLEEKISEMNLLKSEGSVIGALAVAMIDNPMLAATGHRICNDCMKACIYQKQEPVDVPKIETRVLNDVLNLPWGFEIYSLLTRWNPLSFSLPQPLNDYKVLVVGMGPAGFTIAHYLLNLGYTVVAIDGLKIEPLDPTLSGIEVSGKRVPFKLIKNIKEEVFSKLRKPQGFGGVAEYGITTRWDKNYLTVIRLLLERRSNFRLYGGVRFGSAIDYREAKELGFDHIVMASGAGKPSLPEMTNVLAYGCRMASDFLMTLQSGGAFDFDSITNLQIQLPIVVIGGGLTAIDTATESLAYYYVQAEKLLRSYEALGEEFFNNLNPQEVNLAQELLEHARVFRQFPNSKLEVVQKAGGVKIIYRRTLEESPAYRLNHEEVQAALEQGIEFIENVIPLEILVDEYNACQAIITENGRMPARTVLIAIGTEPNTVAAFEDEVNFKLDGRYFKAIDRYGNLVTPQKLAKPKTVEIITNNGLDGPSVSFLGDLHPSFSGNVVKAMASAKQGYPIIDSLIKQKVSNSVEKDFFIKLDNLLLAKIESINAIAPNVQEMIIRAPLAAKKFKAGQFYKFQNYHSKHAPSMEPIALTGALVKGDLISLIVLEMGGSTQICKQLHVGEYIVLMGPTGSPTYIPYRKKVLLIGGGLGNAVLLSIGEALKVNQCEVVYVAGYKRAADRFKIEIIEKISDVVVWCAESEELLKSRPQDFSFKGNVIEGLKKYNQLTNGLAHIDHTLVIGSDKMMAAVAEFKELKGTVVASINSPMQCMMKEICAQCIQRQVDPVTKAEKFIYSCKEQDQPLELVDFEHLNNRLQQNSLQEKVAVKLSNKI